MARLNCTFLSSTFLPSCIEASNSTKSEGPGVRLPGLFHGSLACIALCREINNPDAVNLNSLWN